MMMMMMMMMMILIMMMIILIMMIIIISLALTPNLNLFFNSYCRADCDAIISVDAQTADLYWVGAGEASVWSYISIIG
jgi:hypothetical protein